jgi:hypothetical protein
MNVRVGGVYQGEQSLVVPASGDIQTQGAVGVIYDRFDADIYFTGQLTIDSIVWDVEPKPTGILAGAIS